MSKKSTKQSIAAVLAVTLLLSGTYAWQSFSQRVTNETLGFDADQGTRLHNDFNGNDADVYVENYATEEGATAYTRIRLHEYMEIGTGAGDLEGGNTQAELIPGDKPVGDGITPDITDENTWDIYLYQGNTHELSIRDFYKVNYGLSDNENKGAKIYMPTFNKNFDNHSADIKGSLNNDTDRFAAGRDTDSPYEEYKTYTDGEEKEDWATYSRDAMIAQANNGVTSILETHTAKSTLEGYVIPMGDWVDRDEENQKGNYWVYDTDGWAYWANGLAPQSATSLLVDSVSLKKLPDADYHYGLHVVNQSATADDWLESVAMMDKSDITTDAMDLMAIAWGVDAAIFDIDDITIEEPLLRNIGLGTSLEILASIVTEETNERAFSINWTVEEVTSEASAVSTGLTEAQLNATVKNGIFTPVAGMEGKTYNIIATAKYDDTKVVSVQQTVYDPATLPNLNPTDEDIADLGYLNYYDSTSVTDITIEGGDNGTGVVVGESVEMTATVTATDESKVRVGWSIVESAVSKEKNGASTLIQGQIDETLVDGVFTPRVEMDGREYVITAYATSNLNVVDRIILKVWESVPESYINITGLYDSSSAYGDNYIDGEGYYNFYRSGNSSSIIWRAYYSMETSVLESTTTTLRYDYDEDSALADIIGTTTSASGVRITYSEVYDRSLDNTFEFTVTSSLDPSVSSTIKTRWVGDEYHDHQGVKLKDVEGTALLASTDTVEIDGISFYIIGVQSVETFDEQGNSQGMTDAALLLAEDFLDLPEDVTDDTSSDIDYVYYAKSNEEYYSNTSWEDSRIREVVIPAWLADNHNTIQSRSLRVENVSEVYTPGINIDGEYQYEEKTEYTIDQLFIMIEDEYNNYGLVAGDSRLVHSETYATRLPSSYMYMKGISRSGYFNGTIRALTERTSISYIFTPIKAAMWWPLL